ncbi:Putative dehydrogenase [Acidilobus saccharovorans 345-15]|uniref:Putative dehydrogenase n=1 Tax=Acidilobus saccharovorans (strain DSM 16705 / JCM 18335 / VKM B-2471 / 345-15) TaxID=666510 RepID=D9PYX8_ACIS3|nr:NAD(P)-dependent oxidoreductase [Acidilobus saccharovorans]ADL19765.1 Putative dehydrogenase [Acidilobus saccharovorans 345-15]
MKVAVLGAGLMGSAMAMRLSSQGFQVHVWDRTREKAEALAKQAGGQAFGSPWRAVEAADAAIAFLSDDSAMISVATDMRRADGLLFINSSTITPNTSRALAEHFAGLGICYVEAPVVGGANDLERGSALFLVAGDQGCVRLSRGVLSAAGELIEVGGGPGSAMALKLAYNSVLITTMSSLAEAISLAEAYGVGPEKLKEVMKRTAFAGVAEKYIDRMLSGSQLHFRLSLAAKDLEYASRASFDVGLPAAVTSAAARLYKSAEAHGMGDLDYTKIIEFVRPKRPS